ncbi:MAG: glycosyltransferase family 4 protein [Planctomycetaceae bacterium]|nr:glycosyltransferase family 4 protein [Planctomycetaceae bacterium]
MKLIQPKPDYTSPCTVPQHQRIACRLPVTFIKYRYRHHAGPSGYSRLCDYVDTPTLDLSTAMYWLGETVGRPFCLWASKRSTQFEYSRYDCVQELEFLTDALLRNRRRIYHFIYAEKSFSLTARFAGRLKQRGHLLVGTVHHMPEQQSWVSRNHDHFRHFDRLITMDERSVPYWRTITGRSNVQWVANGVDALYFHPRNHPATAATRVVFAGTHERDLEALEATMEFLPPSTGFEFDLIGKSPAIVDLARRFPHVRHHQELSDEAYRNLLQQCSMLLLPLKSSTFCNVALESMACGLPVVTTKGGIEAYLNSDCAVVAEVGDAAGLAEGLHQLRSRLAESSEAARLQAERFSWQEVARQHIQFYAELLDSSPVTPAVSSLRPMSESRGRPEMIPRETITDA